MTVYRPVRALERGLSILASLAVEGPQTPRAIAERSGIDRATVYRLLETLAQAGFVDPASGGRFRLTMRVYELAAGFRVQDVLLSAIGPALFELHQAVVWPVSYASLRDKVMVVEDSTLSISPYSVHSLKPGTTLSIIRTSVGRAVLSAMPLLRRRTFISELANEEKRSGGPPFSLRRINDIMRNVEAVGYAHNIGDLDPTMSGLALPLIHEGEPLGAVNILFFTKGTSLPAAAERYLPAMRRCVARLQDALENERARARDVSSIFQQDRQRLAGLLV